MPRASSRPSASWRPRWPMPEFGDMDGATLLRLLQRVRGHTGIHMVEAKKTMLQARLRPRMRHLGIDSYAGYVEHLDRNEDERQPFVDAVTTHQTSFFRTPKVWQYFRDVFLPGWVREERGRPLRVWSAAASTGEEACTIAICCEEVRRQQPGFSYEILGTDISTDVLAHARAGRYSGSSVAAFRAGHPEIFERYDAARRPGQFMLEDAVRRCMAFEPHNLMEPAPWQDRFDVVFLRNVLIYFTADDIRRVVHHLAPSLRRQGKLVIGESESLTSLDVPFQFVQPQIYERAAA
ncbi:chemotaxis protein [Paracidovorax avenae]|nr:chemotaxis protein [Paracidovorax avenae]AVS78281.1 chemotaxis protein [Paracidovorax avenae]AVS81805.1 chemotaxis protein [Paracidovorax avenae]AVS94296.1 chemotaxis protein [Paracidovorax avenae]AVS99532.1 chemotaxis protein [Paracidovorax avenae]